MVLLIVALYTTQIDELLGERDELIATRRRRVIIGWVLAAAAILERLAEYLAPSHLVVLLGTIGWLALFVFITWTLLRNLIRQKRVTGETIAMSISVYLLIGFTWESYT